MRPRSTRARSSALWHAEKKTPEVPQGKALNPEVLIDRYEHLRYEVLSHEIGSRLGLSVFLRQGMVGWIQVQALLTVTIAPSPARRSEAPLPKGLAGELTHILTQLIVTRKELV